MNTSKQIATRAGIQKALILMREAGQYDCLAGQNVAIGNRNEATVARNLAADLEAKAHVLVRAALSNRTPSKHTGAKKRRTSALVRVSA